MGVECRLGHAQVRSAIASSRIEDIAPSAQQVALAELGQSETVRGISEQAKLVANNMTVVREATSELVEAGTLTVDHIVELHRSLLPDQPRQHSLRTMQNSIGSSSWSPIGAEYVPPAPERAPALMSDLVDYLNGVAHACRSAWFLPRSETGISKVSRRIDTRHPWGATPRADSAVPLLLGQLSEVPV